MKVIVIKDTVNFGEIGDERIVKDGYARNYLIPNGIAVKATKGALTLLEQKKKEKERKEQKIKEECDILAEKIAAVSCTISMEAGEEDKLFGAVTSEKIAECLLEEGIEVDKKKIILEDPIKSLGVFNVEIQLHPGVKAQARVWVVKK
ncbi:MAG: 50S ribosomal protein L9 [Candidatus Omnitrophica bacterium]|nr:50S ribosomal protein L9 [Candidatus Omnitrophota bacterium]